MVESDHWYVAVLLMSTEVARPSGDAPLVDHQIRLIRAPDAEAAYQRALFLGRAEEHEYANRDGDQVRWRFTGLYDLSDLGDHPPGDGVELYSFRAPVAQAWQPMPKERLSIFWEKSGARRVAREVLD